MSKIKEILGKDSGITISDIEFNDSDRFINEKIEIKPKQKRKNQINKIISELISFLNSGRGQGLLILGLQEKDHDIIKKGVKTLKNKEQIRASVYNKIGTIVQYQNI
jgi:hypothetical protein